MRKRPSKRIRGARIARCHLPVEPLDVNGWYDDKFIAARYRIHPISVWVWARKGILPKPVKIGPNTTRWRGADIAAHERARAEVL
jgi:hypothetical protein